MRAQVRILASHKYLCVCSDILSSTVGRAPVTAQSSSTPISSRCVLFISFFQSACVRVCVNVCVCVIMCVYVYVWVCLLCVTRYFVTRAAYCEEWCVLFIFARPMVASTSSSNYFLSYLCSSVSLKLNLSSLTAHWNRGRHPDEWEYGGTRHLFARAPWCLEPPRPTICYTIIPSS